MIARGVRNNNPGNIKATATPWEGLATVREMTDEQLDEKVFAVFRHPWWGIRAIAKIMLTYRLSYGINTVRGIVDRYAKETHDEDLGHYSRFLCQRLGVGPDEVIDVRDFEVMQKLVKAICHIECGLNDETDPYTHIEYVTGLVLAGLEPGRQYRA